MTDSRIPEFYKKNVHERLRMLRDRNLLQASDFDTLAGNRQVLRPDEADKLIENVIGVFGLPIGLGLNFLINGKGYVVPAVVEEPSIVAALSSAAKIAAHSGGFLTESTDPILIGQVQVVNVPNMAAAKQALLQRKEQLLNLANSFHPKMVARGGGARDIEVHVLPRPNGKGDMLILHLLVDTRDAMGANLVNSMCEGVAPRIEEITEGKVFLRILSNLSDRAMVKAQVMIRPEHLNGPRFSGEQVRDGIILANDFAIADPYRATTHNKGIMNGIDAVAIATGNDWRAIEAAAHAYAGRGHSYTALTKWYEGDGGSLVGELELPMKVGTVGGSLESNPAVQVVHRIMGINSACELAEVLGAVGLAQNFSALRALATEGIQRGHMSLHARSVAVTAGAPTEVFDQVVRKLADSGVIKVWKAKEIIHQLADDNRTSSVATSEETHRGVGYGKVILVGEHAAVYGKMALAAPIPLAVEAHIAKRPSADGVHIVIPKWGVDSKVEPSDDNARSFDRSLNEVLTTLGLADEGMRIVVEPHIPRAMGLGGSAALAVAVIRALGEAFAISLDDQRVNELAYVCETHAHGQASGIDNALATYGQMLSFRRGTPPEINPIVVKEPIPVVIGMTGVESLTANMVERVRQGWERNRALYERTFDEIEHLALQAQDAVQSADFETLGQIMNFNQGLLNGLQVSCREIEELIQIARDNGALGAKMTGSGGGGSIVAVCPAHAEVVAEAMKARGYKAMVTRLGGTTEG